MSWTRAVAVLPVMVLAASCNVVLDLQRKELVEPDVVTDAGDEFPAEPADCRDVDARYESARWPPPPDALDGTNYELDDPDVALDRTTGLMWQRLTGGTGTFDDAKCACTNLVMSGYPDWRLPSYVELATLVDHAKNPDPTGTGSYKPPTNLAVFPDTRATAYWTTTTATDLGGTVQSISFFNGLGNTLLSPEGRAPYRCVRTARSVADAAPRFLPSDGLVSDRWTGLEWQQSASAEMKYAEAFGYCTGLTIAGKGAFRMPTIKELMTLLDGARKTPPFVDPEYFPNLPETLMASTRDAETPSSAYWVIVPRFSKLLEIDLANETGWVLCVRTP